MSDFVLNEKEFEPRELLNYYSRWLAFYRKWANRNSYGYWILVWLSAVCAALLLGTLLLQASPVFTAASAIGLNFLFALGQVLRCDKKYPRCRAVQIKLDFALHEFKCAVARQVHEGKPQTEAIFDSIPALHQKAEAFIMEEYSHFFRDLKTLEDLHQSLLKSGHATPPGRGSSR